MDRVTSGSSPSGHEKTDVAGAVVVVGVEPVVAVVFQLFLAFAEARRFMRVALAGSGMTGEEYGIYSYFFANGPQTLSQAATDLGYPITTLASTLAPILDRGDMVRTVDPADGRARPLELSAQGEGRLEVAGPSFRAVYGDLTQNLETAGADPEEIFAALESLRTAMSETSVAHSSQPTGR